MIHTVYICIYVWSKYTYQQRDSSFGVAIPIYTCTLGTYPVQVLHGSQYIYRYMVWVDETPWRQCSRKRFLWYRFCNFCPSRHWCCFVEHMHKNANLRPRSISWMDMIQINNPEYNTWVNPIQHGTDGMAKNVLFKNKRWWDAFLLQHATLVIQFTMIWCIPLK